MKTAIIKDMLGRNVKLTTPPKRIISLVPSLTELLYDLDLDEQVVGITKFCIKPNSWFRSKTRIGGTKSVDFKKIKQLAPDLIIANKEENTKEEIEQLSKLYNVWISDINSYREALIAIQTLASICDKTEKGQQLIQQIEEKRKTYLAPPLPPKSVLYLIWKNPYMATGTSTYIDDILKLLGYQNCFLKERYQAITIDEIKALNPDLIFFSSEPYPFKTKDFHELQTQLPDTVCRLVDGELMSWYGSRLLHTFSDSIFID
ncbi:MAG: helical backbone metal receptor [Flavobacteriales bacterium]|nr:helical backbone metal receptor [Flavobacteriales bacterium]